MRWESTIWMSAVLAVATSKVHLTIDNDLLGHATSTTPSTVQESIRQEALNIGTSSEDVGNKGTSKSTEKTPKNDEPDNVKVESSNKGESNDESINKSDGSGGEDNDSNEHDNGDGNGALSPDNGGNGNNSNQNKPPEGDENGDSGDGAAPPSDNDNGGNGAGDDPPDDNDNESDGNGATSDETVGKCDDTIVETTTASVCGYKWRENSNIIGYIDIQYGTFKSLFEDPVSPDQSETLHEVKDHSKRCPQLQDNKVDGDTDCLTLSIFKPSDATNASVLVHIHEGNFITGSANPAIYGPEYLVSKGIILVLPNYRLGPLGFLCMQNGTVSGNAALKDLSLALSWVKDNIAKFGGDPENIAVSGDGTSGALAGYLALSPMSKSNIKKVITESGAVLSPWALDRNPIVTATALANSINEFQSWQEIDMSVLLNAAKYMTLRPCLEKKTDNAKHFMVETPWKMIEDQNINITFMIGSAKYAGVHEYLTHTEGTIAQLNQNVGLLLPDDLEFENSEERNKVGNKVKTQYFGNNNISVKDVELLTLYYTDALYLGPGIRTARPLVQSGATVYFYEFSFVGSLNRELEAVHKPVEGAVRGDIIGYLFTQDGLVPAEDTKERRMVDQLIQLWTSFLKTGTPSAENIEWKKLEKALNTEEQWLSIDAEISVLKGLHVNRLSLWTDIYEQYYVDNSRAFGTSPSVYTVILLQLVFFISFFGNTSHFF